MPYTLRFFFFSKCSLFHNANLFGSCIIHILYTGCAKIKKKYSGAKRLKEIRYAGHVEDMSVTRNGSYILFKDLPVWEPKRISVDKRKVLKSVFVTE